MGLVDALKGLFGAGTQGMQDLKGFAQVPDADSLNFCLPREEFDQLRSGGGDPLLRMQMVVLRMLQEQGACEPIANGFRVPADVIVALDEEQVELLRLPQPFPGTFKTEINGRTGNSGFRVSITLLLSGSEAPVTFKGPFLELGGDERYLLGAAELLALQAWRKHCNLTAEGRGEAANLRLMAALQTAARSGMSIDLGHFEKLDISVPDGIGVVATRLPDGSLQLCPSLGDGSTPEQLERRWAQLDMGVDGGVMRVENRIVLLDPKRLEGVKEVLGSRRIPADRVAEFLATPTAFLDAALVDLDVGFSVRVLGVGKLVHMEFGAIDASQRDWFALDSLPSPPDIIERLIKSPEELQQFEEALAAARAQGADVMQFAGERIAISDVEAVDRAVALVKERQSGTAGDAPGPTAEDKPSVETVTVMIAEAEQVRGELLVRAGSASPVMETDWEFLARKPFPHQEEGVRWMTGLMDAALSGDPKDLYRLQGALLADDMGLGKTYMTLVAANEYLRRQSASGRPQKPILVVAPLTLLENWEDEVAQTFLASPFRDIVVLQSGRDLRRFRDGKVERESSQLTELLKDDGRIDSESIRYALSVGPDAGARRLDMDRRLVLTTYQTLRDYQLSLCRVDWGLVIFDEAQNTKNPNALQTRAAKGLKGDFKLLATGTPVENSLGDFWCLMDTAQPGLLGTWSAFRDQWIRPIVDAPDESRDQVRRDVGASLRKAVGAFMLRRTKEDQLADLPSKTIHCGVEQPEGGHIRYAPALGKTMRGSQLAAYDEVLSNFRQQRTTENMQGKALATLQSLREISLHPRLRDDSAHLVSSASEARSRMQESCKLAVLLELLESIRAKGQKVILFMVTKRLQRALKLWLDLIFDLDIAIINGDTPATSSRSDVLSRKQLITDFESRPGFDLLIMSPVAAGVGLTVVGANRVVHLERHWNPAKEAQASDRVYRIGQTRDVHIHLPAALHPQFDAFDVHLDRLLRGKLMLKDAVVIPESVSETEMIRSMGL